MRFADVVPRLIGERRTALLARVAAVFCQQRVPFTPLFCRLPVLLLEVFLPLPFRKRPFFIFCCQYDTIRRQNVPAMILPDQAQLEFRPAGFFLQDRANLVQLPVRHFHDPEIG